MPLIVQLILADAALTENTGIAFGIVIGAVTGAFIVGMRVQATVAKIHQKLALLEQYLANLPCQIKPPQCDGKPDQK